MIYLKLMFTFANYVVTHTHALMGGGGAILSSYPMTTSIDIYCLLYCKLQMLIEFLPNYFGIDHIPYARACQYPRFKIYQICVTFLNHACIPTQLPTQQLCC